MAYDKAVDSTALETGLTTIADAIRSKGGTSAPLDFPQGMADAVAAISGSGDSAQEDAIITGSAVTIENNRVTEARRSLFSGFPYLTSIKMTAIRTVNPYLVDGDKVLKTAIFPKAKRVEYAAFNDCFELTDLDISSAIQLDDKALRNCKKLVTLVLPALSVCKLAGTTVLSGTPISQGAGFVYVPKALVEQYKVATNWVTYAEQIRAIEDYPEITGG